MVYVQAFLYKEVLVATSFIFLINLVYFPIAIAAIVREDPGSRRYEMIERWRSSTAVIGTKNMVSYISDEMLKFSILFVTLYQIAAIVGLYYYAVPLFSLVHTKLE